MLIIPTSRVKLFGKSLSFPLHFCAVRWQSGIPDVGFWLQSLYELFIVNIFRLRYLYVVITTITAAVTALTVLRLLLCRWHC